MCTRILRLVIPIVAVVLVLTGCGDSGDGAADTTLAATTSAAEATTTTAVATTTVATTTTTQPSTTTTTEPESVFAAPEVYEKVALDYCSQWPDVESMLTDDANYAEVTGDGLTFPEVDSFVKGVSEDVVVGRDAVVAVLGAEGISVDCGSPAVVSGDWVVLPVSSAAEDGSGTVGIWALRVVRGHVQWHFAYGTPTTDTPPPDEIPNAALVAEAREFCAVIEGTGYVRSAEDYLGAMTGDPAVHNYAEGLYWTGVEEVGPMIELYPKSDQIWCSDEIITNGDWSAEPITIDNPAYNLKQVGVMVRHHVEGQINSEFVHFTRTSGEIAWGLPLEDLEG